VGALLSGGHLVDAPIQRPAADAQTARRFGLVAAGFIEDAFDLVLLEGRESIVG